MVTDKEQLTDVHLTLSNKTYIQVDDIAMGSHLGPVLVNILWWSSNEI